MKTNEMKSDAAKYLMNNYGERGIALVCGKGARVWDSDGKEYLDFLAGISVNNLGHCHPKITNAIKEQADNMIHCSNLYLIEPQIKLAKKLIQNSCFDKAFFCNSGAEANEGAVKLARLYAKKKGNQERYRVVTFKKSFHGRTLAMISATGQDKIQKGFEPLVDGFDYAEFNDIDSVYSVVGDKTCAVMIEPVQGEGGIVPAEKTFLRDLRKLCDNKDILLIFDEIQCGLGRTGKSFAYQNYDVCPDVVTLAKALGGGVPIAALLANGDAANTFDPGNHGTTFGGNALATAAALAYCEELFDNNLCEHVNKVSEFFFGKLKELAAKHKIIKEIRGIGLMIGIMLDQPGKDIAAQCMKNGLLLNCTADVILRILPPLIVTQKNCEDAISILDYVLSQFDK